ncbi:MAG: hypothetical protein RI943_1491 [Bacteroidota bacterium]
MGLWYRNILMILLAGLLLVDLIGGYSLAQGEETSVMLFYKAFLAVAISLYLLRNKSFWLYMLPTAFFIIFLSIASLYDNAIGTLGEKLALLFRFIFNCVVFLFLVFEFQKRNSFERKYRLFIYVNFLILVVSILLGAFGIGNTTYSDVKIGSKGFFEGGNDIGVAYLALGVYILYYLYSKGKPFFLRLFFIFFQLVIALLASTKLVIIGTSFGILYVLWRFNKQNILIKYFSISIIVSILVIGIYWGIQSTGLMDRILGFYENRDLLFVLLSGRDNTVSRGFERFGQSNLINQLFGFSTIQNSEMDGFDILFNFGFVGIGYFLTLAFILYRKLHIKARLGNQNAIIGKFIFVFCTTLGFLAGHTLFSTQGGLFLFSVVAIGFCNPSFYVEK